MIEFVCKKCFKTCSKRGCSKAREGHWLEGCFHSTFHCENEMKIEMKYIVYRITNIHCYDSIFENLKNSKYMETIPYSIFIGIIIVNYNTQAIKQGLSTYILIP